MRAAKYRAIDWSEYRIVRLVSIPEGNPKLVGRRVIELGVDFVQIVTGRFVLVQVVEAAGKVRGRNKRNDLLNDRIDPVGRNDVPRERRSPRAIRIAGIRIVNRSR